MNSFENKIYYTHSEYLRHKYGEKVYKLPINLPITCPNHLYASGCTFCAEIGTGFEALENSKSVTMQLMENKKHISKKYKAKKYIAYFQNYTNTFMSLDKFKNYIEEAAQFEQVVEISISTRPDCLTKDYLDLLQSVKVRYQVEISIELGLQSVNYKTLDAIQRGHSLGEFLDSVLMIQSYAFHVCVHIILNLPTDTLRDSLETAKVLSALPIQGVKIHSLYIPRNTVLCHEYINGKITICSKEEYIKRLIVFIEHLRPDIVVERLFGRIPDKDAVFSNWGHSWWKLRDEFMQRMLENKSYQGISFDYLKGAALRKGGFCVGKQAKE